MAQTTGQAMRQCQLEFIGCAQAQTDHPLITQQSGEDGVRFGKVSRRRTYSESQARGGLGIRVMRCLQKRCEISTMAIAIANGAVL